MRPLTTHTPGRKDRERPIHRHFRSARPRNREPKARAAARVLEVRDLPEQDFPSIPQKVANGKPFRRAEAIIDFPIDAVGTDLAALMTIALGGVYSIKGFSGIRVVGMELPSAFANVYPGPQFAISGSRELTGVYGRPIIGTIVKPALGLLPEETAELVRELVQANVDFVKDDEKLASPPYSLLRHGFTQ